MELLQPFPSHLGRARTDDKPAHQFAKVGGTCLASWRFVRSIDVAIARSASNKCPMAKPNYSDWAETKFQLLCDEAGVTRNKAFHDRTGWDYLVEFDRPAVAGLALDRQSGSATARVQVKSQRRGKPRYELKLSNALRFCREANPCFVVFIQAPGSPTPRYFVREFDEELMALTLRRAREADRDGQAPHLVRLNLTFDPNQELHEDELLDWIKSRTVVDPIAYGAKKAELNRTLGFDRASVHGSFTYPASETQKLIEHGVGLTPNFDVDSVQLDDVRFDIPARQPMMAGKPSIFRMQVHPRKARITFAGANGRIAQFDGEFRSMNLPGLADDYFRATFKSPRVNGVMEGRGPIKFNFKFPADARQPLKELCNQASLVMASKSRVTPTFWVERIGDMPMEPVELQVENEWSEWFDEKLAALAKSTRPADKPNLSLNDLGFQQEAAERFANAVGDGETRLEFVLSEAPKIPLVVQTLAYYAYLEAGDSTFLVIAHRPCLEQSFTTTDGTARFGSPVMLERAARRGPVRRHLNKLRARFEILRDRLGNGVVTLEGGDFMALGGTGEVMITH